jgi:hypothetical protein
MVNLVYCYQGQGDMPHAVCLKVKSVGKPDAVAPHVRFDERGWETGLYATAPVLDSTGNQIEISVDILASLDLCYFLTTTDQLNL